MTDQKQPRAIAKTDQTEHERRVAEEEQLRRDPSIDAWSRPDDRTRDDAAAESYEREIEAERRGMTAEELEAEKKDDNTPLDVAYKPKSG
jgi:hypothetical protein